MKEITMLISNVYKYCFSGYGQYIVFRTKVEAKSYLKNNSVIYRIKDLLTITDELREKISNTSMNNIFECIDDVAVPFEIEMEDMRSDELRNDDSAERKENTMIKTGIECNENWWSIKQSRWMTIDEGVAEQWQDRLQTLREKSVAGINFSDALDVVITREEYRTLSDDQQRELIQAWLYPTNDEGEIDMRFDEEIKDQLWNDDDSAERQEDDAQWYRERAQNFDFHPFTLKCDMCLKSDAYYIGVTVNGTPFGFCKSCRDELQALKIEQTQSPERFGV